MSSPEDAYQELKNIFSDADSTTNVEASAWTKSIRDKLLTMFCSPLKDEYLQEAFRWVSQLCLTFDNFSWISTSDQWTKEDCRMFSCITKLSMNEIQILMPLVERHLTVGDEPELEKSKVLARSAETGDYDRFGVHLVIMESTIRALVKNQGRDEDTQEPPTSEEYLTDVMESRDLQSLLDQLKGTMNLICNYLELVHRHWERLVEQKQSDMFSSAMAALRIICVWISEDSESFQQQCRRFIVDLIISSLRLKNGQHDIQILALHSICTYDRETHRRLKSDASYQDALEQYLCHMQKERDDKRLHDDKKIKMFKLRCGLVRDLLT